MRHVLLSASLLAVMISVLSSAELRAEEGIRIEPVHFKAGASSATIKGSIKGYEGVDYVLEAGKGQHMTVNLSTDNASSYFNVLAPGENEAAMFIGSTSGNQFKGTLPATDAYKIRVYLMRNAARRNEVANYQLEMAVTGAAKEAGAKSAPAAGGVPSKDEQACLQAVATETNNGDVVTLSVEPSEANTLVMVGVGPNRAPWKCLSSGGVVADVMSMTDEGKL